METVSFAKWLGLRTAGPGLVGIASDGRTVRLAELRGKVVLVNFWAPWYPHCKQEMTWFAEMQRDMGGAGLARLSQFRPVFREFEAFGIRKR
jgi:thiol-disulfide isomerase/thioredoxin